MILVLNLSNLVCSGSCRLLPTPSPPNTHSTLPLEGIPTPSWWLGRPFLLNPAVTVLYVCPFYYFGALDMLIIPVGLASFMFWTSLKICRSHFEVVLHLSDSGGGISPCLSFLAMVSFIFTLTLVDCLLSCSVYLGGLEPGKVSPNTRACVIPRDIVFVFFILTNMDCFSWVACYWRLISNSCSYTNGFRARMCISRCPRGTITPSPGARKPGCYSEDVFLPFVSILLVLFLN